MLRELDHLRDEAVKKGDRKDYSIGQRGSGPTYFSQTLLPASPLDRAYECGFMSRQIDSRFAALKAASRPASALAASAGAFGSESQAKVFIGLPSSAATYPSAWVP